MSLAGIIIEDILQSHTERLIDELVGFGIVNVELIHGRCATVGQEQNIFEDQPFGRHITRVARIDLADGINKVWVK